MLVYFALGDASFSRFYPTPNLKVALGPGVGSLRWACTFHALGDANSTRRKPGFWWNMGLKVYFHAVSFTS